MRIITKTIRLRVRASLMNKGRARSEEFGLVPAPGSALGRKAVGMRAAVGGRTVTIGVLVAVGAVVAVRVWFEQCVCVCVCVCVRMRVGR